MSAVMSEAENKFFSSRGTEVDPSLTATPAHAPADPTPEPAPKPTETPKAAEPPSEPPVKPAEAPKTAEATKPAEAPKPVEKPAENAKPPTPEGFVPQQALHTERQKRQQLEEQNRQLQAQVQQIQQWLQSQQQLEQPPNPTEDPYGALQYELAQQRKQLEQANQWREQQEQSQRQQRAMADLSQRLMSSEHVFRATHPDYDAAADHALQQYDRLLSASVPDPIQRQQQVRIEAANALARAIQNGQDPAEFIYTLARNMGYTPPVAAVTPPAAVAPAIPPAAPVPAAVADVAQTLERGMKQQAKSGGGAGAGGEMTAEQLAAINDPTAFNEAWKKAFRK